MLREGYASGNRETRLVVLATPAPVTHRTAEENLGLGYLAAHLRKGGFEVSIIDGWLQGLSVGQLASRILEVGTPLWVGFSCYRTNMARAMETVSLLRISGCSVPFVAGGYGPTFESDAFLEAGFDIVAVGEAELSSVMLSQHLSVGVPSLDEIPGLVFARNGQLIRTGAPRPYLNLDDLETPARDTIRFTIARKSAVHVETARGCKAGCIFCSIVAFARSTGAPRWRQKSISRIVDELEEVANEGATVVKIIDDSLVEPPRDEEWAAMLADAIEHRGIKLLLRGSIRADRVTDSLLGHLKRAGFVSFSCGIENYSSSALRRMAKSATVAENLNALAAFRKHGLFVQAGHILFDPGTTMTELRENLQLMREHSWTISKGIFTEMYAAAGTAFTRQLAKRDPSQSQGSTSSMNRKYDIEDEVIRHVHQALKAWQLSHTHIYDKAIDVLSSPKAVDIGTFASFHGLSQRLRERDLDFFERLLDAVESESRVRDIEGWTQEQIHLSASWYSSFEAQVDLAYRAAGLHYDADLNPFLC